MTQMRGRQPSSFCVLAYGVCSEGEWIRGPGKPKVAWSRLQSEFTQKWSVPDSLPHDVKAAVSYLCDRFPAKQVLDDGKFALVLSPAKEKEMGLGHEVVEYVRRVRNNLFHGGKFNQHWFAEQRSIELINHSLTVVEFIVKELSDDVSRNYEEGDGRNIVWCSNGAE